MALTRYHARMRRLRALESRHAAALRVALIRQAEVAVVALEQFAAVPNAVGAAALAVLINDRWLVAPLQALYVAAGVPEARDTYDHLTGPAKGLAPLGLATDWAGRLRKFITTEGAAAVRGITETTRKAVRKVLNDAAQAGSSIPDTVKALRAKIGGLATKRARTIARTELITAANIGSYLGASATGLRLRKRWLATPGGRTRPTHSAANGQTVGMEAFFSVGGAPARYPGDPMLPAGERCNCRCSITYVPD